MEHVTEQFAAATVLDLEGGTVRLDSLWAERVAVIGFVRHYG